MFDLFSDTSEIGARVDVVQFFLILVMAFWFIACNAVLVYFMLRYRRKGPDDKVSTIKGNHTLEVVWTVIPTIMVLVIFYYGINVWTDMRTMPEDSYDIRVTGQKWSWVFEHPDGRKAVNELYVPVGENVKMIMNSTDVIHSMFIPEFRVKEDVVPSIFTYLWFKADKAGTYNIFCTEYCGKDHSAMLAKVHVLDAPTWERFINNEPLDPNAVELPPVENGEQLYTKLACVGCHTPDGSGGGIGPTFKGLYGREEVVVVDGQEQTITVDDNYIMESIKYPEAKLAAGYPSGQMPAFDGILSDDEIGDIIAYIKTLK